MLTAASIAVSTREMWPLPVLIVSQLAINQTVANTKGPDNNNAMAINITDMTMQCL